MRVLILGASGLIGGNSLKHFRDELNWNVVGTYFTYQAKNCVFYNTLNAGDPENFQVEKFNPEVILHCGALTFVDYCEDHEGESYEKTVLSTKNALDLARLCKSKFIYISTDYVFDGLDGPYREDDKVNPISIYGKHKLEAENLVRQSGLDFLICRVTNVYGEEERGKNFIARLAEKAFSGETEEMSFPADQYATPVNAADVAKALGQLILSGKSGLYHLAGTDYLNRYQLVTMVLRLFPENKIDAKPVRTAEMNQKAGRPLNGGLIAAKFLGEFPTFEFSNVCDYLMNLKNN